MLDHKSQSWFYPKATGNVGRDRNARTLQFSCLLFTSALGIVAVLEAILGEQVEFPMLVSVAGLIAAMAMNRAGRSAWAGRTAILAMMLGAILLVLEAHDGFRSHAMLVFPGLLLISVMLLDRLSYLATGGAILLAVAALGIAEKQGLTQARPGVRTSTSYDSIFYVDLTLAVFAMIGTRIVNDVQRNVFDLRASVEQLSAANLELTKTAEALRESEERFRSMADSAPVMIWVSGLDNVCTFFNKPWLDFTGRTMHQELGNGWAKGVHPDDVDRYLEIYNSSFHGRRSFQMDYRLRRADGEYRWVLDHGTPLYRAGEFAGFIGSCIDMTEQKLLADRLHDQTVQLRDAQRLANIGSWERHHESNTIDWSEEMFRIFGVSGSPPADVADFVRLVHPKDREKVLNSVNEVYSSVVPVELSYRIIRPDGEVHYVRTIVQAIRSDRGAPVRLVGAVQDITEQVKTFDLLRESEQRLKTAEHIAHLGHWTWDLDSHHVSWSEEMFHIFGQPSDYTPSYDGFFEALIPQDRERLRREVRDALADHSVLTSEAQVVRPNGELRTITFISEAVFDEEGNLTGMFGATQDTTEVRRAQRADFARQKLESVGRLASGIAHDFNNLLGSVLVQAEVGLRGLVDGSNSEEELKTIRDVALRGSEIVRELMIYAGKESPIVETVDLSNIVKEMLELLKVSVSKHAMLVADLGKNVPSVRANAAQLRQIVMNLVINASDALGDQDGIIRLSTRRVRVDEDSEPDGLEAADYTVLEVCDTGSGITPETQGKVFDPFFTTKSAGHGLGLAIVDGIVRSLHGRIRLNSEPGKGTTFQISLPCADSYVESDSHTITATEDFGRPFRYATVLIVEDEGPLREAVAKMLRRTGFEVFDVGDGSSAIDVLRANATKIDLILLDMTIPGASSREVVDEAVKVRPYIKVVLTSAYSEDMIAGTINAPQVRGFIRKPFQLGDLVKMLQNTVAIG